MKRGAAGAHLPTPWLIEPAKRPDDRADYCLGCSFLSLMRTLGTHFSQLSELGRALQPRLGADSGKGSSH